MWNKPTKDRLNRIPRLYETENVELKAKLIYLHFFLGGSNWYACEFDGEDTFWGFAILNGDLQNAEWGYFCLSEMQEIRVRFVEIDCELERHWQIRPASHVNKICQAQDWRTVPSKHLATV